MNIKFAIGLIGLGGDSIFCFRVFLAPKDMFPWDEYEQKYAIHQDNEGFNDALWEIENSPNVNIDGQVQKLFFELSSHVFTTETLKGEWSYYIMCL